MRTIVYIDGFNLYYRALRNTPYKWLNIETMARIMLRPNNVITRIKYFTARVSARPHDPDQPVRQNTYLRALHSLPSVEIMYGTFLTNTTSMRLAHPVPGGATKVDVLKTEEKGSDVNLASHLVHDAHLGRFDSAVVVTSDSDLCEPIRLVNQDLHLPVGVFYPSSHVSAELAKYAAFLKPIRRNILANSQFPAILSDSRGIFHKPNSW